LRDPRKIIVAIANNELQPSDLISPHLLLISSAFAPLEGDERDAFLRLLLHVQSYTGLFITAPVVSQFGAQPGNTFIEALSVLAKHHKSWIRTVESWRRTPRLVSNSGTTNGEGELPGASRSLQPTSKSLPPVSVRLDENSKWCQAEFILLNPILVSFTFYMIATASGGIDRIPLHPPRQVLPCSLYALARHGGPASAGTSVDVNDARNVV
jgi:hypothetical protein